MSIAHVSRTGKVYYLHGRPGKGGKHNFFFSTDDDGEGVDIIPEGFEIHENIRGQVFLRHIPKKLITDHAPALPEESHEPWIRGLAHGFSRAAADEVHSQ